MGRQSANRKRSRWRFALYLLALTALMIGLVLGIQRLLVFPRYLTRPQPSAGDRIAGLDRIWHDTPDGRVEAWLIPGDGASAERPAPLVVFAHGNGELIEHWPEELAPYRRMGVSLLMPEYRGYGRSAGSPSEQAIADDFEAIVARVAERPDIDASRIVYHGRSIGGGVVCALSRRRAPRALILSSTFTSVADIARRFLVPRFLVLDPFDNTAALRRFAGPTLIVHGLHDGVVPVAHAHELSRLAPQARLVLYDADHNDCPPDPVPFWAEVERFLGEAGILSR
jgi:fermentation-respiration switch protein FrsA (DUF1100 family)